MYGDREGFKGVELSLVVGRSRFADWQRLLCFVFWWSDGRPFDKLRAGSRPSPILNFKPMPYRVISFTMAQVRQGALGFQRELSAVLREHPEIKVYSVSPFDLDERRRFKDRFGGDIVYFLNDAACQQCERLGLSLEFLAEISDEELPRRRTLVVGTPKRTGGASQAQT
jgi:hypothetical protein